MTVGDNFDTSKPGLFNKSNYRRSHESHHPCNIGCGCVQQCANDLTGYQPILPQEMIISIVQASSRDEARKKIQLGEAERFHTKYSQGAWRGRKCCFDSDARVFYVEDDFQTSYFEWPVECTKFTDEDSCNDKKHCKWGEVPFLQSSQRLPNGDRYDSPKMCTPNCALAEGKGSDEDGGEAGRKRCSALGGMMQCAWKYVDGDVGTDGWPTNESQCVPDSEQYEEDTDIPNFFKPINPVKDWSGCEPCSVSTIDALVITNNVITGVVQAEPNLSYDLAERLEFNVVGKRSDCTFSGGDGRTRFAENLPFDASANVRTLSGQKIHVGNSSRYREAQFTYSEVAGLATFNYTLPVYDITGGSKDSIFHNRKDKSQKGFYFNTISYDPEGGVNSTTINTVAAPVATLYSLRDERTLRIGCVEDGVPPRKLPNYCSIDGQPSNFEGNSGVYIKNAKNTEEIELKGWPGQCEEFDSSGTICLSWKKQEHVIADGEVLISKCMYYNSQVGFVEAEGYTADSCPQGFQTYDNGVVKGYLVKAVRPTEAECTATSKCCKFPLKIGVQSTKNKTALFDKFENSVNYDLMSWISWEGLDYAGGCVFVTCEDLSNHKDECSQSKNCVFEDRLETDPSSGAAIGPKCYNSDSSNFDKSNEAFFDKYKCLAFRAKTGNSNMYWSPDWEVGEGDPNSCCGNIVLNEKSPNLIPSMRGEGDISGLRYQEVCYTPYKELVFQSDGNCNGIKNIYDRNYYHNESFEDAGFFNVAIRGCDYYGNCLPDSVLASCNVEAPLNVAKNSSENFATECNSKVVYTENSGGISPCKWNHNYCCAELELDDQGNPTGEIKTGPDGRGVCANDKQEGECNGTNEDGAAIEQWADLGTCQSAISPSGKTKVLHIPVDQFANTSNFAMSDVSSIGFSRGWVPRRLLDDPQAFVGGGCPNKDELFATASDCPPGCVGNATCWIKKDPPASEPNPEENGYYQFGGEWYFDTGGLGEGENAGQCVGLDEPNGKTYYYCGDIIDVVPFQDHSGLVLNGRAFPGRPLDNKDFCYCASTDTQKDFGRPGMIRLGEKVRRIGQSNLHEATSLGYPGCPSESELTNAGLTHIDPEFCASGGTSCSKAYYPESAGNIDFLLDETAGNCSGDPDGISGPKGGFHEKVFGYCKDPATGEIVDVFTEEECVAPNEWVAGTDERICGKDCVEKDSGYIPAPCSGDCFKDGTIYFGIENESDCTAVGGTFITEPCSGTQNGSNCDLGPDQDGNCWKLAPEGSSQASKWQTCLSPSIATGETTCNVIGMFPYTNVINRSEHALGDYRLRNLNLQPQPFKATENKSLKYKTLAQAQFDLQEYQKCIGAMSRSDEGKKLAIQDVLDANARDDSFGYSPCHGNTSNALISINRGLAYWFEHDFVAYICKDAFGNEDSTVQYDVETRRCFRFHFGEKIYNPTNWNNGSTFNPVVDTKACELLSVDISNYRIINQVGLTDMNCKHRSSWALEYKPDATKGQSLQCFPERACETFKTSAECPRFRCDWHPFDFDAPCKAKDPDNCSSLGLGTTYTPNEVLDAGPPPTTALKRCEAECSCPNLFCEPDVTLALAPKNIPGFCPPIPQGQRTQDPPDYADCDVMQIAHGDKIVGSPNKSYSDIDDPLECGYCEVERGPEILGMDILCGATASPYKDSGTGGANCLVQATNTTAPDASACLSEKFAHFVRDECAKFEIDPGNTGINSKDACNNKDFTCTAQCGSHTTMQQSGGGWVNPNNMSGIGSKREDCLNAQGQNGESCCIWAWYKDPATGLPIGDQENDGWCLPGGPLGCNWMDAWKQGGVRLEEQQVVGYVCKDINEEGTCQEASFLSADTLSVLYREGTLKDPFDGLLQRDVEFIRKRDKDSLTYWGETGLWPEHKQSSYEATSCKGNQRFGYVEHASLTNPVIVKSQSHRLPNYPSKLEIGYVNNDPVYGNFVVNAPVFKKDWVETEFHAKVEGIVGDEVGFKIIKKEAEIYSEKKHGKNKQVWPLAECPYDFMREGAGGCLHDDESLQGDYKEFKAQCGTDDEGNPCIAVPSGFTPVDCDHPEKILDVVNQSGVRECYAEGSPGVGSDDCTGWCEDLSNGTGVEKPQEFCIPPFYKWHADICDEGGLPSSYYRCVSKVPRGLQPNCDMARTKTDCDLLGQSVAGRGLKDAGGNPVGGAACEWVDHEQACKPSCSFRFAAAGRPNGIGMCSYNEDEEGILPAEFLVRKPLDNDHFSLFTCDGQPLLSTENIAGLLGGNFCPKNPFSFSGKGLNIDKCQAMNKSCCPVGCEDIRYSGPVSSDGTTLSSIKHHLTDEIVAGQDDTSYNQNEFVLTNDPQVSMTCGLDILEGGQVEILGNAPWSGTWNHYADGILSTEDFYGINQNTSNFHTGWDGSSLISEPPADDYYVYIEHEETCPVCCDHFLPDTIHATITDPRTGILNDLYADDGCGSNTCDGFNAVGYFTTANHDRYGLPISEYRECKEGDIVQYVEDQFAAINLSASLSCNAQEYSTMQDCKDNNKQGYCTNTSDNSRADGIEKDDCVAPNYKYVEVEGKTCECKSVPCSGDPSSTCHVAQKVYDNQLTYLQEQYASLRCDAQKQFCARPSDQIRNNKKRHQERSQHLCCQEQCIPGDYHNCDKCSKDYPTIEEWMDCNLDALYATSNGKLTIQNITCEIDQNVCFTDPGMAASDVFENCGECVETDSSPDPFACSGQSTRTACNNAGCEWSSNAGGGAIYCDPCMGYPNNRPFICEPECIQTDGVPEFCKEPQDLRCGGSDTHYPNPHSNPNYDTDNAGNTLKHRGSPTVKPPSGDGCPFIGDQGAQDDGFHCYADKYTETQGCQGWGPDFLDDDDPLKTGFVRTVEMKYTDSAWRSDWFIMGRSSHENFSKEDEEELESGVIAKFGGSGVGTGNCHIYKHKEGYGKGCDGCCYNQALNTVGKLLQFNQNDPQAPVILGTNVITVGDQVFGCDTQNGFELRKAKFGIVRNADCGSCPSTAPCTENGIYVSTKEIPKPTQVRDGHFGRLVAQCGPEVGLFETLQGNIPPDALGEDRTYADPRLNMEMEVIHCATACNRSLISAAAANSHCPSLITEHTYGEVTDASGAVVGHRIINSETVPFICVERQQMIDADFACTKGDCHSVPGHDCGLVPPCTGTCEFVTGTRTLLGGKQQTIYGMASALPQQADTHLGQYESWEFSASPYYPKKPTLNRRVYWAERVIDGEDSYDILHIDNRESCGYEEGTIVSVGKAEKFEAETGSYPGSSIDKKSKNPYISGNTVLLDEILDTRGASQFGVQLPAYTTIKVRDASELMSNNNALFRQFAVYEEEYDFGTGQDPIIRIKSDLPSPYGIYPIPMPVQSSQQVGTQAFGAGRTPGKAHVGDSFGVGFGLGVHHSRVGLIPTADNLNREDSINGKYFTSVVPFDPTTGIGNEYISIENVENIYDTGDGPENGNCLFEEKTEIIGGGFSTSSVNPQGPIGRLLCILNNGHWVPNFLGTLVTTKGTHDLLDNELITISGNRCYSGACAVNGAILSDSKATGCYEKDGFGTVFNITEADCKKDPDLVWYDSVLDIAGVTIKASTVDKTICEVTLRGVWGPDPSIESAYDYEQGCPVFCRNQAQIEAFRTEEGCRDPNFCQDCEVEKTEGEDDITHCPLCAREQDGDGRFIGLDGEHIVRVFGENAFFIGWQNQVDFEADFTRIAKYRLNPLYDVWRFGHIGPPEDDEVKGTKQKLSLPHNFLSTGRIEAVYNPVQLYDQDGNSVGFHSGLSSNFTIEEPYHSPYLDIVLNNEDQLFQRQAYDLTKVSSALDIISRDTDKNTVKGYFTDQTKKFLRTTSTLVQSGGTLNTVEIDSFGRARTGVLGTNNLNLAEIAHCGAQHDSVVVKRETPLQIDFICAHISDCAVLDKESCADSPHCLLQTKSLQLNDRFEYDVKVGDDRLQYDSIKLIGQQDEIAAKCSAMSDPRLEYVCGFDPDCRYRCDARNDADECIFGACMPETSYLSACAYREHAPTTSDDYNPLNAGRTDEGNILSREGYKREYEQGHGNIVSTPITSFMQEAGFHKPSMGSEFTFAAQRPNIFWGTESGHEQAFLHQIGAMPKRVFTGWVLPKDLKLEEEKIYGYWSRHVGSFNINIGVPEALPTQTVSCRENNSNMPLNMTYYMTMPDETCQTFKPPKGKVTAKGPDLLGGPVMTQTEPGVGTSVLRIDLHE